MRFVIKCALTGLTALLPAGVSFGQSSYFDQTIPAQDLARRVIGNELHSSEQHPARWIYRVEKEAQGKRTAKEVVQTGHGSIDRLVSVDGHPLNSQEQQKERERIENLARNPAEQQRLEQSKKGEAEQCRTLFKLVPDALTFSYAAREGDLIKLSYRPNSSFQPPSREARVFHAMEGEMWVDKKQQRLARIQGRLTSEVKFAGGFLGHLEKGGYFNVEQHELSPGQWDLTFVEVNMRGKALFFKSFAVQQKEYRSDFRWVPGDLTIAEAAAMLTSQVLLAANR